MSIPAKSDEKRLEQRLNDAQILFDEADDVPISKQYEQKLGLYLLSPSGALPQPERLYVAKRKLNSLGFAVKVDKAADGQFSRFSATDEERVKAFARAAKSKCDIVMATRGGYGLTRILHKIDWQFLADNPKTYVGYSDFTAFNLALLAKTGLPSFTGPNAVGDFGGDEINDLTADIFVEMMRGELEILSFLTPEADPVDAEGVLWGGNLALVTALAGTPYMPTVKKGILFLEDVSEPPYRVERLLTQLLYAGILEKQKAIVLGDFTDYKILKSDHGFDMPDVIKWLRQQVNVPIITGLPYGHGDRRVTLPIGKKVGIATEDGMAYLVIDKHDHSHEAYTDHQGSDRLESQVNDKVLSEPSASEQVGKKAAYQGPVREKSQKSDKGVGKKEEAKKARLLPFVRQAKKSKKK